MTTIYTSDANTGNLIPIDTENPSGLLNVVDADTGDIVELDLSALSGVITVVDADSGDFVDIDYSNPSGLLNINDPNTGEIVEIDLANPSGIVYSVDENTGDLVELDLSTDKFINTGGIILAIGDGGAPADVTAPTLTISVVSVTGNVAAMQILASEEVTGFEVGDITISEGGSLASFATADNITFTVSWTLAAGANTMDIAAEVCEDLAGNKNTAATQYPLTYLVLQPDSTTALDTFIRNDAPTANSSANTQLRIGNTTTPITYRSLIKFDLSSIAAGSTIYSAILSLYAVADNSANARTFRVFRLLRAWVLAEVTWNVFSTVGGAWATAGGFGAADCEQTDIGNKAFTDAETLNEFKSWTLTASAVQEMITGGVFTNNGFLVKADTETADLYNFASANDGTAGNRPKFAIVYRPNS